MWPLNLSSASILSTADDGFGEMRRIDLPLIAKISDAACEPQQLVKATGAKSQFVDGRCQAACHVAVQVAYALQSAIVELCVQASLAFDLQSPCSTGSLAYHGAGLGLALFAGE